MPRAMENMPVELWQLIVQFLDAKSTGKLLRCSKYLSFAVQNALDNHKGRFWPVKVVHFKKRIAVQKMMDLKTKMVVD